MKNKDYQKNIDVRKKKDVGKETNNNDLMI